MKEYILSAFEETDFKDPYGNFWCNAVFEGVGEPVKVVTPNPEKWVVGDNYFGEIETKKSKAGKDYLKFKRGKPEDNPVHQAQEDKRGESITRSMVVKLAYHAFIQTETMLPQEPEHWRAIQYQADMLYKTINTVDDSKITETPATAPENPLDGIKGDTGNPALRRGLKKTGHDFGVANEPLPEIPEDYDETE